MARKKTKAVRRPAKPAKTAKAMKKKPAAKSARPANKTARRAAAARPAPASNPAKRGLELLTWTHGMTTAILSDWPLDRITFQCSSNDNHALWTIGHLATTYSWLASLLDGHMTPLPDSYNPLFGMGSKPVADATLYPPMGEVRQHFDSTYARFADLAAKIKPADARKPTVGNSHGFAKDRADVLDKAAWHEGWHSGQLSTLRRALGLKGLM